MSRSEFLNTLEKYLKSLQPSANTPYKGDWGLQNVKKFHELLGNPQNDYQVIHIAGTSGKGSVSMILAKILTDQGLKIVLHTSPFIDTLGEAFQVLEPNFGFKWGDNFNLELAQTVLNIIQQKLQNTDIQLSFYEALSGFYYLYFKLEKVDVAIIEVGLGGRLDCTNTVTNPAKISVLSTVGYDHTEVLGDTLESIATQQWGIVQPGNWLAIGKQEYPEVKNIFLNKLKKSKNSFQIFETENLIKSFKKEPKGYLLEFTTQWQKILKISNKEVLFSLNGQHQLTNLSLALGVMEKLFWLLKKEVIPSQLIHSLRTLNLPYRFEIKTINDQFIILDAAHNPQKMRAFIDSVVDFYPGINFDFMLGFIDTKDISEILKHIQPIANRIIFTQIPNLPLFYKNVSKTKIVSVLESLDFDRYEFIDEPPQALDKLRQSKKRVIVTGSMYLLRIVKI